MLALFLTFLKIGAFTFGGGYAMIALLEEELVSKKKWIEKEEFLDIIMIAESTPGPVAVNCATYIGYKLYGVPGATVATLGVCVPSFSIIYVISLFLDEFLANQYVAYAFKGIQVCVVYLILMAGFKLFKEMKKDLFSIAILLAVAGTFVTFSLLAVHFSTVFYILICGAVGICFYGIKAFRERRDKQ